MIPANERDLIDRYTHILVTQTVAVTPGKNFRYWGSLEPLSQHRLSHLHRFFSFDPPQPEADPSTLPLGLGLDIERIRQAQEARVPSPREYVQTLGVLAPRLPAPATSGTTTQSSPTAAALPPPPTVPRTEPVQQPICDNKQTENGDHGRGAPGLVSHDHQGHNPVNFSGAGQIRDVIGEINYYNYPKQMDDEARQRAIREEQFRGNKEAEEENRAYQNNGERMLPY